MRRGLVFAVAAALFVCEPYLRLLRQVLRRTVPVAFAVSAKVAAATPPHESLCTFAVCVWTCGPSLGGMGLFLDTCGEAYFLRVIVHGFPGRHADMRGGRHQPNPILALTGHWRQ